MRSDDVALDPDRERRDRVEIEQLREALVGSRQIGPAIGIVMALTHRTYEQAHEYLKQVSQTHNRKLRDLAASIVLTGEVPEPRGASSAVEA